MTDALIVNQLTKSFADVKAVAEISFCVPKGTCFGLLGPNGAGKTTTLEILEGILEADSGSVEFPLLKSKQSLQSHIGIQFQETALQDHLKVNEALIMFADLYGTRANIDNLIELCSLRSYLDRDTKKLSGGQRQRLLLALALLHNPEIIFLDEPTTGLDPQSRRNFWELVQSIKSHGKTLILTTHYMDEAHQLCDEIAVIDNGKIIAQGVPSKLIEQNFDGSLIRLPITALNNDQELPFEKVVYHQEHFEIVTKNIDADLKKLLSSNVSLDGLHIHTPNLEDLFIKLTGHELRA
ncbi:ABC transporter ATP-binding protein [Pleionea sediminis]|uniref:ABC transporter ATP-binding protein n=1 Tax=Pleionea sediminis TaxID=2569479 RepID=UPI0011850EB6|nr:ABC transporter ATP-binding protein [Pleionea sediminis]